MQEHVRDTARPRAMDPGVPLLRQITVAAKRAEDALVAGREELLVAGESPLRDLGYHELATLKLLAEALHCDAAALQISGERHRLLEAHGRFLAHMGDSGKLKELRFADLYEVVPCCRRAWVSPMQIEVIESELYRRPEALKQRLADLAALVPLSHEDCWMADVADAANDLKHYTAAFRENKEKALRNENTYIGVMRASGDLANSLRISLAPGSELWEKLSRYQFGELGEAVEVLGLKSELNKIDRARTAFMVSVEAIRRAITKGDEGELELVHLPQLLGDAADFYAEYQKVCAGHGLCGHTAPSVASSMRDLHSMLNPILAPGSPSLDKFHQDELLRLKFAARGLGLDRLKKAIQAAEHDLTERIRTATESIETFDLPRIERPSLQRLCDNFARLSRPSAWQIALRSQLLAELDRRSRESDEYALLPTGRDMP